MLANAGRLPLLELDRIRQDKLKALKIYAQAQKDYKQLLDEFKITLSMPTMTDLVLDENELEAARKAGMTVPDFSEVEVLETALLRRLDLSNSADMVIDAQRKVFVAADTLRAELNMVGSAKGVSARRADRSTLGSFREEYGVGFELDLPLDRVPEQHIYRKALINLEQRQREYDQAADEIRLQVRQAHRDLSEAAERYRIYTEGLELARKRFEDTFVLLQYGRASSRRVLDAQDDLFDAQNSATQALIDYTVATLNFYRDTGVLQVRPDGMWQR
jgi:outer membrane protein TolC